MNLNDLQTIGSGAGFPIELETKIDSNNEPVMIFHPLQFNKYHWDYDSIIDVIFKEVKSNKEVKSKREIYQITFEDKVIVSYAGPVNVETIVEYSYPYEINQLGFRGSGQKGIEGIMIFIPSKSISLEETGDINKNHLYFTPRLNCTIWITCRSNNPTETRIIEFRYRDTIFNHTLEIDTPGKYQTVGFQLGGVFYEEGKDNKVYIYSVHQPKYVNPETIYISNIKIDYYMEGQSVDKVPSVGWYLKKGKVELINQNLQSLMFTQIGQLIRNEYFGSRVNECLEEPNTQTLSFLVRRFIKDAIESWEPRLRFLESKVNKQNEKLFIYIRYEIINNQYIGELNFSYNPLNNNINLL